MELLIKKLHPDAKILERTHHDDAGLDISALETFMLEPGAKVAAATGLAVAIPTGYVGLIWDKSSVPFKYGVKSMGGVIDAQYRGEVKVMLINLSQEPVTFTAGQKLAQLIIQKIELPSIQEVSELPDSVRGEGGFGSSGTH
jgi:dUTP pyrophosphatase